MTPEQFLEQMLDVLNREEPIGIDDALADIEEWDSIAYGQCQADCVSRKN